MKLLTLLQQLFGKRYINKIIGTKTNVTKPTKMDKNSPFRKYSDDAFSDPKILNFIENKLDEYAPYALSNRNKEELANFEANAQRLLEAKNKQTGTTPGMAQQIAESMFGPLGKKPKPEADIIDIKTQQKVDDTGIMKLKEKLGSPKATETSSSIDNLKEDIAKLTDREARAYSANIESFRRPIIREMLLKDTKIKLPDEVRESLEKKMDLDKGANPEMDPLRLLNEYYDVDFNKLDELEEIRFTARNATEAADEFLKKGGLEPKKPMVRESLDDEAVELEETKDLGDKLKDYDGDPDGLADGGRPGYAYGTGLKLINLLRKQGTNVAKEIKRSLDNIFPTGDAKYDADVMVDEIMENLDIDRDAVDGFDINDLYGRAYDALTKQTFNAKKLMKSVNQKGKGIVTTADNIPQPTKTLKSIEDTGSIDISNDEVAEEFANFMKRNDPEGYEKLKGMTDKINSKTRTDNANGGLNYLMGL
jgi:hypothetical protein